MNLIQLFHGKMRIQKVLLVSSTFIIVHLCLASQKLSKFHRCMSLRNSVIAFQSTGISAKAQIKTPTILQVLTYLSNTNWKKAVFKLTAWPDFPYADHLNGENHVSLLNKEQKFLLSSKWKWMELIKLWLKKNQDHCIVAVVPPCQNFLIMVALQELCNVINVGVLWGAK